MAERGLAPTDGNPVHRTLPAAAERGRCASPLFLGLLVFAAGTAGCREQVFEPVRDGLVSSALLEGEVRVTTKADLLFVVDDSPSMANEQDKLAAAIPELVARLDALDPPVDYRAAVLTTTVDERFGPCDPADATAPEACSAAFGGTGFACEAGACVRRFPQRATRLVAAPGQPTVVNRALLGAGDFTRALQANVRVGLDGARHEQPLRALTLAFESGALDGFWRPDARLVVLVATDEDDCSDSRGRFVALEQTSSGYVDRCEDHARRDTEELDLLEAWERSFRSLPVSGGRREVSFAAITGLADGSSQPGLCTDPACATECTGPSGTASCDQRCQGALQVARCRDECVASCVRFCGAQVPGWRLARLARRLGGPLASICESSYGPVLARLAAVMGIPEVIELPSVPSDRRAFFFRVVREGRTIECREGPDYELALQRDPPAMVIQPGGACRLLPGDQWTVRYVAR